MNFDICINDIETRINLLKTQPLPSSGVVNTDISFELREIEVKLYILIHYAESENLSLIDKDKLCALIQSILHFLKENDKPLGKLIELFWSIKDPISDHYRQYRANVSIDRGFDFGQNQSEVFLGEIDKIFEKSVYFKFEQELPSIKLLEIAQEQRDQEYKQAQTNTLEADINFSLWRHAWPNRDKVTHLRTDSDALRETKNLINALIKVKSYRKALYIIYKCASSNVNEITISCYEGLVNDIPLLEPIFYWEQHRNKLKTNRQFHHENNQTNKITMATLENYSQAQRELLIKIVKSVEALLGKPPCAYSIIMMGSMARGDMNVYSDIELGLLLDDDAEVAALHKRGTEWRKDNSLQNLSNTFDSGFDEIFLNFDKRYNYFELFYLLLFYRVSTIGESTRIKPGFMIDQGFISGIHNFVFSLGCDLYLMPNFPDMNNAAEATDYERYKDTYIFIEPNKDNGHGKLYYIHLDGQREKIIFRDNCAEIFKETVDKLKKDKLKDLNKEISAVVKKVWLSKSIQNELLKPNITNNLRLGSGNNKLRSVISALTVIVQPFSTTQFDSTLHAKFLYGNEIHKELWIQFEKVRKEIISKFIEQHKVTAKNCLLALQNNAVADIDLENNIDIFFGSPALFRSAKRIISPVFEHDDLEDHLSLKNYFINPLKRLYFEIFMYHCTEPTFGKSYHELVNYTHLYPGVRRLANQLKESLDILYEIRSSVHRVYGFECDEIVRAYTLYPMHELKQPESIRSNRIYLSDNGDYTLKDAAGIIRSGSLKEVVNLDNLHTRLHDIAFKEEVLRYTAAIGHTLYVEKGIIQAVTSYLDILKEIYFYTIKPLAFDTELTWRILTDSDSLDYQKIFKEIFLMIYNKKVKDRLVDNDQELAWSMGGVIHYLLYYNSLDSNLRDIESFFADVKEFFKDLPKTATIYYQFLTKLYDKSLALSVQQKRNVFSRLAIFFANMEIETINDAFKLLIVSLVTRNNKEIFRAILNDKLSYDVAARLIKVTIAIADLKFLATNVVGVDVFKDIIRSNATFHQEIEVIIKQRFSGDEQLRLLAQIDPTITHHSSVSGDATIGTLYQHSVNQHPPTQHVSKWKMFVRQLKFF